MAAGTAQARYATVADGSVMPIAIDHDHEPADAKADREERPNWAIALGAGWAR